jgi:hypothetical protein
MIMSYTGAWFGDPALKEEALLRLKEHRAQDRLIQGWYQAHEKDIKDPYWSRRYFPEGTTVEEYKGCAIGCTLPYQEDLASQGGLAIDDLPDRWYQRLQDIYNIDFDVARLIDDFFEAQDNFEDAAVFAVDVIEAIEVGADLHGVPEFDAWGDYDTTEFLNWLRSRPIVG